MTNSSAAVAPLPRRRRRWVTWLLAVLIFLVGVIAGSALTVRVIVRRVQYAIGHPEQAPEHLAAQLRRPLKLSDSQVRQVEQIFARHQASFQAIRRDISPRVESELEATRQDVADVLDDVQRAKWQAWYTKTRATWMPPLPSLPPTTTTRPVGP